MQIAQQGFLGKTNRAITSAVRNTSCNRGWLQVFTHIVCGTFTVTSFILILLIALQIFPKRSPMVAGLRCYVSSCRVICHEAPYYELYEDDVILAVMEAETQCQNVFLSLIQPAFTNETMPQNWLARMRSNVFEVSIIGGNLRHIPQNAFSSYYARHIKLLLLENITISSWTQHMLLGLASLESIFIKSCNLLYVQENALMPVSQTLKALTVMDSGHWDPSMLTGSSRLSSLLTVDYSSNVFGTILGNTSFSRLRHCKSLYLSYSRITYIGPGAFDNLRNIEYLNLDNNFLKTIEPHLFHAITSSNNPRVRINLVDNLWHCDCAEWDLRRLIQKGVLLVDPTCHTPTNLRGKTFTEFNYYCKSREPKRIVVVDMAPMITEEIIGTKLHSFDCDNNKSLKLSPVLVSPFKNYECAATNINTTFFHNPTVVVDFYDNVGYFWIKPTIVIRGINFTMIELGSSGLEGYGLIWYRSSCPNEIFCVNVIPEIIRLYNMNLSNQYTFCPVTLPSGSVKSDQCIAYSTPIVHKARSVSQITMYILVAVSFLFFGALCLYMLIRQYPALLKGSKRLLFVKHKNVDALVLPPKVPLRSSMLSKETSVEFNGLRENSRSLQSDFQISQLTRSRSIRSTNSCAPSYISALQPTEEQLCDWRLKHLNGKFENDYAAITTISSDVTPISILSGSDNLYYSFDENSQNSISIGTTSNLDIELKSIGPV
ncbi:uncharacterized protein [Choristoneura fumiferana]|uniref:uncharacterized protein n=1 Tax=Choristoneura fumiferana TaxID=7141 RepID=UPI003D1558CF